MLAHALIPPVILAELLDHVERKLIEHFKEHELAMTEIHQYYNLSFMSYGYTADILVSQSPVYVAHYQQQTLALFSLQTVPVPYHPNRKPSDEKHVYTL